MYTPNKVKRTITYRGLGGQAGAPNDVAIEFMTRAFSNATRHKNDGWRLKEKNMICLLRLYQWKEKRNSQCI